MAEKCVYTHKLRTVSDVARDLATLQCLCKSVSTCASSAWPALADKLCDRPYGWPEDVKSVSLTIDQLKHYLPVDAVLAEEVLQQAANRQPAQLVVFVQMQRDKKARYHATQAKQEYFLSKHDLKALKPLAKHNRHRFSAPCLYSKQVTPGHFLMSRSKDLIFCD